jgi:hypothetical protein
VLDRGISVHYFINVIIINLKLANNGCFIQYRFLGCLLYADDIILLSPSLHNLQRILNTFHWTIVELGLVLNCLKLHCICFGPQWKCDISPMKLGNSYIDWAACIDNIGVRICAGRSLIFYVSSVKQSLFAACNCIYQAAQYSDQLVHHLALQEAYYSYLWHSCYDS